MLEPDILKPYLLDDDPWVRTAVARYFDEGWSQDEELVPLILDACERFGYQDNVSSLACCRHLPLTPTTFERVLRLLAEATDDNTAMHLSSVVAHAPVDLLSEHEAAVLRNTQLLEHHLRSIRHRLDFMSWSGERLWQALQEKASGYEASDDSSDGDSAYDDAVIDALARHDVPDAETICRVLADPATTEGWLEMFLVDLAGVRRLSEAIPALVDVLRRDDATLPDNCFEALARIGHPEIVRRIQSRDATKPCPFRDAYAVLLGEIKQPESEEAILACLEEEDDIEIRTELCHSLCRLFAERGVEVVRRQIRDGYQGSIVCLEEALLPVTKILGIELPEAKQWRKEREEREQYQLDRRLELDEMAAKYDALKKQGIDPFAKLDSPREAGGVASATYRRHDGKVGRNDPCPCGSGKKYKKCCDGKG